MCSELLVHRAMLNLLSHTGQASFPYFNARLGAPRGLIQGVLLPPCALHALPCGFQLQCSKVTNYLLIARTNKLGALLILFDLSAALHALLNPFCLKSYPPPACRPHATWFFSVAFTGALPSPSSQMWAFSEAHPQLRAVSPYSHSPSGHPFPGFSII